MMNNTPMDPALHMLDRALRGDPGALSFLESTASIYILDLTNNAPKTYGCWNFLNQALSEVERYEQKASEHAKLQHQMRHLHQHQQLPIIPSLESHVQLLCTMSRKAARRSPESDRRLIGICLANADPTKYPNAQALIELNCQTREQVMGRIAAMAFDFAYHNNNNNNSSTHQNNNNSHNNTAMSNHHTHNHHNNTPSAFSNPIAMDGLCAILAANAISNGPEAVREFAMDWIVPSVSTLPPSAIVSVVLHLATESMGKAAPAGTEEALCQLSRSILADVLGPLLIDALRESDVREDDERPPLPQHNKHTMDVGGSSTTVIRMTRSQRLTTVAIRALERWCTTTQMTIAHLNDIFTGSKVDITMAVSDSLYSHTEPIIDASAELLDTLLQTGRNSNNSTITQGDAAMNMVIGRETDVFLGELVSAIGLQRFRFTERQSHGDNAVCRCLARIAATVAMASQSTLRSGKFEGSAGGIADLLLKAAAHPSVHVSGMALEALPSLVVPGHNLSDRLLPILQQKVLYPDGVLDHTMDCSSSDASPDLEEFHRFREDGLSDTLVACYLHDRVRYLESCALSVEASCASDDAYRLEGALFLLGAVSVDASKRALLVNSSPAAQAAVARAFSSRTGREVTNIAEDAVRHNGLLVRCVSALARAPVCPTSNPLVLSQLCRCIGKYANWFAKTPTLGVLDSGAELALMSFKLSDTAFRDDALAQRIMESMSASPFAEASSALRNILCRAPSHFATPQALSALAGGWESSYASANTDDRIGADDREALCSGICRVLTALPPEEWVSSLGALARPTIDTLESVRKRADDLVVQHRPYHAPLLQPTLQRGADEIRLLATMTRTFNKAAGGHEHYNNNNNNMELLSDHPSLALLRGSWPVLSHLAQHFSTHDVVNEALGEFLTSSVSSDGGNLTILKELCEMAATVVSATTSRTGVGRGGAHLTPTLEFVTQVIDVHGRDAESNNNEPRRIVEGLLTLAGHALHTTHNEAGQHPSESCSGDDDRKRSLESLSALFSLATVCVERCPILFVHLGGDNEDHWLFRRCVHAAVSALSEKELDTARAAMIFVKSVVDLLPSSPHATPDDARSRVVGPPVDAVLSTVRRDVVHTLVHGAFGLLPREALDSAAALTGALLLRTPREEGRDLLRDVWRRFSLGDEHDVSLRVFGRCVDGTISPTYLMDFFSDLWDMHQTDDLGAIAGGNVVKKFEQKYGAKV